jgi:hypothetical protein
LGSAAGLALGASPAGAASGWTSTGDLADARRAHAAVALPDGRVLAVSGFATPGEVASSELWDPATGTWSAAAPLAVPRHYATATVLPDGRVLVAGGFASGGVTGAAELYDPATGSWSTAAPMLVPRQGHAAVLLADGRVLVAGGTRNDRTGVAQAELYDPAANTWTATGSLAVGREWATAAVLANGEVLLAGGHAAEGGQTVFYASAERYSPVTGTWTPAGPLAVARSQAGGTALADGRVLVANGVNQTGFVTSIEIFDPASGTWAPGGTSMIQGNVSSATRLDGGRVLLQGDGATTTPLYDPATGSSPTAFATAQARTLPSVTRLGDGRVLLAGGSSLRTAELFTPPTERTAADHDFGAPPIGQAVEHDVVVRNSGDERLWIDGTTLEGPSSFSVLADSCAGATVPVGGTCVVRVRYVSAGTAAQTATLRLDDNAEGSAPVLLRGAGAPPAAPDPGPARPDPGPATPAPGGSDDAAGACRTPGITLVGIEPAGTSRRPRVRLTAVATADLRGRAVEVRRDGRTVGHARVGAGGVVTTSVSAPRDARSRARARYRLVVAAGPRSLALKASRAARIVSRKRLAAGLAIRGTISGVQRRTALTIHGAAICDAERRTTTRAWTDRRGRFRIVLPAPRGAATGVVYRVRVGARTVTLPVVVTAR